MRAHANSREVLEERALGWLQRSLDFFDPFTYSASDRTGRLAARKALVELAALVLHRRRVADPPADERYLAIVERIAAVASRRPYRDLIARQQRSLWLFGIPYAALRAWGRDEPELRWMLEQAVAARYPVTWERLPYRYLDYRHFLDAGHIHHTLWAHDRAFALTLLAGSPNVAQLEEDDVYAITHAVFYMTEYGLGASHWPRDFDADAAAELIDTLLAEYTAAAHGDLTAELLICAACLGQERGDAVEAGWNLLHRLQSPTGSIPAPDHLVARSYAGERDDSMYLEWKRCYHTTIMSVMAALSSSHVQQPRPAAPRSGASEHVLTRIEAAVLRGAAWLRTEAEHAVPARALIAATGAVVVWHLDIPDLGDASRLTATEVAGRSSRARATAAQVAAAADLFALLQATLRMNGGDGDDELLAFERATTRARPVDDTQPIDGSGALALARIAIDGGDNDAERARWRIEAVRAFHEYRLGDAAAFVSVLVLAGAAHERAVRDVAEALCAQQRLDGSFGYAAVEVEDDALAEVRVLWTARCVWALAAMLQPENVSRVWAKAAKSAPVSRRLAP